MNLAAMVASLCRILSQCFQCWVTLDSREKNKGRSRKKICPPWRATQMGRPKSADKKFVRARGPKSGTQKCSTKRGVLRRFPMEPFSETLWGPLVPISAYLCPLGVAILRY